VLQAITSASNSRIFSAFVRRRTGTGTVEITQDNGSTWTAITLTTSFQRFTTSAQTLTNPTVGFRIVTSGDEIDVDFCQAETGAVATSPIVTAGSTVARTADSVTLTGASSLIGQTEGTLFVEVRISELQGAVARTFIDIGSAFNRVFVGFTSVASNTIRMQIDTSGVGSVVDFRAVVSSAGTIKVAAAYKNGDSALYVNGVAGTMLSNGSISFTTISNLFLGQTLSLTAILNDGISQAIIFPTRLSNSQLQALTT
jgi:hypothetical protein